ncbi:carboxypeptidase regulatory-like domain-containing protein, partial [Microbacterium sp. 18062]|uniref:carboxypeptidase regulatory-like domain-containing protein n=1 Tax=Microbacterium sp. 18062 TaxID=2681410 RepID=UPI00190FAD67
MRLFTTRRRSLIRSLTALVVTTALVGSGSAMASALVSPAAEDDRVHTITGTVTDDTGAPVPGVWVMSEPDPDGVYGEAITGDDGRYELTGLAPASWLVSFHTENSFLYYDNAASRAEATPVVIPAGEATTVSGIDVVLPRLGTVQGVIAEADRGVVQNISLEPVDDHGRWASATYSREDGSFVAARVMPGTYRLIAGLSVDGANVYTQLTVGEPFVVADGEVHAFSEPVALPAHGVLTVALDGIDESSYGESVEVLDTETNRVLASTTFWAESDERAIVLPAGTVIIKHTGSDGAVSYYDGAARPADATPVEIVAGETVSVRLNGQGSGSISGTVTGASGEPLAGIGVETYRANDQYQVVRTVTTRDDGTFSVAGLRPDNYALKAVGGATLHADAWFGPDGTRERATAVEIGEGATFSDADIVLAPGGGVTGRIEAPAGISWMRVDLYPVDGGDGRSVVVYPEAESQWSILGLPAGTYSLSYSFSGGVAGVEDIVEVVAGAVTEVPVFAPTPSIHGVVTQAETGDPVPYAEVRAHYLESDEWGEWWNWTSVYADPNGAYSFYGFAPDREYFLEFTGSDRVSAWWEDAASLEDATPVVVSPDEPRQIDVALGRGITVSGTVVDAISGAPVGDVWISASGSGSSWASTSSSQDGTFELSLPGAGVYGFSTDATDTHVASSWSATVPAEGLSGERISLQAGYTVSGDVRSANLDNPLGNIGVQVVDGYESWVASGYTGSDGTYTTSALPAGEYRVQFSNWQGLYVEQWYDNATSFADATVVSTTGGSVTGIDAGLVLGGLVRGTIVDENGEPLAGATVGLATAPVSGLFSLFELFNTADPADALLGIEVTTDANGQFALPPVPAGSYTVYVYTPERGTTWLYDHGTRADADVIEIGAGQSIVLDAQSRELAPGAVPRTPEQSLSDAFEIVRNPVSVEAEAGYDAEFTASASGDPLPDVQWQERTDDGWRDLDAENSTTLYLPVVGDSDNGREFRAVFTQGEEELTSGSATLTVLAAATVPATLDAPSVTQIGATEATVEWAAPADDGGASVVGYELSLYAAGSDIPERTISVGAVTSQEIGGLSHSTDYEVSIAAVNRVGAGEESPRAAFSTPRLTVPGTPTVTSSTATSATELSVAWDAPGDDGGSPITGYVVEVLHDGSPVADADVHIEGTAATVSGLTPETSYTVTVAATNVAGTGAAASASVTTPAAPPE